MDDQGIDTVYGKVCLRKQRKQRRKNLVGEQLQDFTRNTTLHGLRYITERGVTRVEKIFWLIFFLMSVGICLYQIHNVWVKRQNSPMIVSISERLVPVSEVLFPSVTICPQWKIGKEDYDYAKGFRNILHEGTTNVSTEPQKKFEDISLICDRELYATEVGFLDRKYSDSEVMKNIEEASQFSARNMEANVCRWRQNDMSCAAVLKKVITEKGICYNFNALAAEDIFRTDQIQQNYSYIEESTFSYQRPPKMGRQNGAWADLVITFEIDQSEVDEECNPLYSGFTVYLQHPSDMPQSSLYYYAILPGQTSSFALKYNMITSEDLKEYDPKMRHCYYNGERYLRYFKIYTENNCRMECLSNYTFEECGCVGFHMPYHRSDRICTIQSVECMQIVLEKMAEVPTTGRASGPCNCLPACDYVEYDAEILKTDFNAKRYVQRLFKDDTSLTNISYSRLEMYFKSPRYLAMRRSELFGQTDFIANCGGLLGLFLGFSFLSLVEIIYFITLRIWCTFKRDTKDENIREVQDIEKNH